MCVNFEIQKSCPCKINDKYEIAFTSLFWTECRVNGAFYRRGENYSSRLWIAWTLEWVFVVLLQTYFVKKLWDLNIRGVQKIFSSFSSRKNMWILLTILNGMISIVWLRWGSNQCHFPLWMDFYSLKLLTETIGTPKFWLVPS